MNIDIAVGEEFDSDDHHQLVREMERSTESPDVVENPLAASKRRSSSQSAVLLLKFLGSLLCLSVGILTWILMAEILQGLFQEYPKPYFLAFWIHSYYSVMYVVWKVWREFPGNCKCNASGDGAIHWKSALWGSFVTGMVALVCAYFWYLSLTRTSVPANTAIYQSCVAFVFILSVPILKERITIVKIFAVLFAIGGVAMISFFSEEDKSGTPNTPLGFVFLIVSTVLYALLEVLFKKFASPKDDPSEVCNSVRYVGLMGVHTLLWAWIPIVILHFSGIEKFDWPSLRKLLLNIESTPN